MSDARLSVVVTSPDPDARWSVSVVAKRTYAVVDGQLVEAAEQVALVEGPRLSDDGVLLLDDSDLMLRRPMVDVVVKGHAYPHEGDRQTRATVRVGALRRQLQVYGDRRLELDHQGAARFTPPERFERVSLGWESAYGGYDAAALEAYGDPSEALRREGRMPTGPAFGLYAYPRNPAGKGYLVELSARAAELCRLPNLEEPGHLLTPERMVYGNSLAWPEGPPPASTMWLPYAFFPRMTLLGFPPPWFDDERFQPADFWEVRAGLLAPRALDVTTHIAALHDLRGAQGSAPGMRVAAVQPGDLVELTNVHPRFGQWGFSLSVRVPRVVFRIGADPPVDVVPKIRTVLIEPDDDRVCVVWVAETPIPMPLRPEQTADVQHAVFW